MTVSLSRSILKNHFSRPDVLQLAFDPAPKRRVIELGGADAAAPPARPEAAPAVLPDELTVAAQ